jgi:hypothetical protein
MEDSLFHVQKNGKVGFINNKGQVIIDFEFDEVSLFSEGLARVFYKDKVGCVDTKGNLVIPIQFKDMLEFSEGLAVVTVRGKQGYIDKTGQIVIPPKFYEADSFQNGFAKVRENMMTVGSFINKDGKTVLTERIALTSTYSEGLINCKENEKWGYMNISGEVVINPCFEYARPFYEGKAAVQPIQIQRDSEDDKVYGFINKQGEMIIPPLFRGADLKFSEDRCAVWDQHFGYIDSTGEHVIPYQYYFGEHFSEGMACVKFTEDGKYGFIDKEGNAIFPPISACASNFENGLAAVFLGEGFGKTLCGYIDNKGNYIWEPSR